VFPFIFEEGSPFQHPFSAIRTSLALIHRCCDVFLHNMAANKIPTFQPFQDLPVSPPTASVSSPSPREIRFQQPSKSLNEETAIFENRDLLFSLLSDDINTLLHPHPTFITPLTNYLNLDYDNHDLLSLNSLIDQDIGTSGGGTSQHNPSGFQRKTNIQQLDYERKQKYQEMELYLREQYLVCHHTLSALIDIF
jgi:hypothetical protein